MGILPGSIKQVVYSILPHRYSNLTWGELLVVQRVDETAEERKNPVDSSTHVRYLYLKSIVLHGTVQLWQWCHLCIIYDQCLLIQCMWLMQPLGSPIQSLIDLVYWLMGQILSLLMSNSWWPIGLLIGLQFNRKNLMGKQWSFPQSQHHRHQNQLRMPTDQEECMSDVNWWWGNKSHRCNVRYEGLVETIRI